MCFIIGMAYKISPSLPVFDEIFDSMITPKEIRKISKKYHSGLGAPSRVGIEKIIKAGVFHELVEEGTKAEHLKLISGKEIKDSSLTERYKNMDKRVLKDVMEATMQPLSNLKLDPEAYHEGLLLLGVDGGNFSLANTPSVKRERRKANARCGKAAFAKMGYCAVYELAHHEPVLVEIDGKSEMVLANELWPRLPLKSLSLADRYYGNGQCIGELIPLCEKRGNYFLFRVKEDLGAKIEKKFTDGSRLVTISSSKNVVSQVREIYGKITARTGKKIRVRFWTNLLNARVHTARKLLKLYSMRWEQEIGYNELKNKLHRGELLKSHTPHTAFQELASLFIAQVVIAKIRRRVGHLAGVPTLRVSFGKTRRFIESFWITIEACRDILTQHQINAMGAKIMKQLEDLLTPPRRKRSCPRKVRQPVNKWPRLHKNTYAKGEIIHEVIHT